MLSNTKNDSEKANTYKALFLKISIIIGITSLLISLSLYILYTKEETKSDVIEIVKIEQKHNNNIVIDISGAIVKPGVYTVPAESRINDVVVLAGGVREDANKEWVQKELNLAAVLHDGQKLYIPFTGEDGLQQEYPATSSQLINLNTATQAELESLPRIGPATAQRIIDYRQTNGKFSVIEDLLQVPGIGEGTFDQIKTAITVK